MKSVESRLGSFVLIVCLLGGLGWHLAHAQTVSPPITIQSTVAHTSCVLPPSGTSAYCFASDGLWESINGAAYVQLTPGTTAGVTSVTVCNAAGSSCGSALTGAVSLDIPKTATTTVTSTASTTIQ